MSEIIIVQLIATIGSVICIIISTTATMLATQSKIEKSQAVLETRLNMIEKTIESVAASPLDIAVLKTTCAMASADVEKITKTLVELTEEIHTVERQIAVSEATARVADK